MARDLALDKLAERGGDGSQPEHDHVLSSLRLLHPRRAGFDPSAARVDTREGLIFQQGGGAGINLTALRSSREPVMRGGLASGPVSFMRATDAWAKTIRAGGRAGRGHAPSLEGTSGRCGR